MKGIMFIIAVSVIFFGLAFVLFLMLRVIGKTAIALSRKRSAKVEKYTASGEESGEICAAIIFALNDYSKNEHDIENTVLTIEKVARTYSPWSSKIYNLREIPGKK